MEILAALGIFFGFYLIFCSLVLLYIKHAEHMKQVYEHRGEESEKIGEELIRLERDLEKLKNKFREE